jgi:hypothetical protein
VAITDTVITDTVITDVVTDAVITDPAISNATTQTSLMQPARACSQGRKVLKEARPAAA